MGCHNRMTANKATKHLKINKRSHLYGYLILHYTWTLGLHLKWPWIVSLITVMIPGVSLINHANTGSKLQPCKLLPIEGKGTKFAKFTKTFIQSNEFSQWYFLQQIFAILWICFLKKIYSITNSLSFEKKKKGQKKIKISLKWPKIVTTTYNLKGCLRFFYFHILNVAKIWLNILMDGHHLTKWHTLLNGN